MQTKTLNYIRPQLTAYQSDIIDCKERFSITEAGTKVGKTVSHIIWLFEKGWINPLFENYWWISPVYSQSEIAYNRMKNLITIPNFFQENKSKLTLTTPLGTVFSFKTAEKPDNLYGEDVGGAVFDEFTRAKKIAWTAIYTTVTATKAPCKLIGNNKGVSNWGYILGLDVQKNLDGKYSDWKYTRLNCWDAVKAGVLAKEIVEDARNTLSEQDFNELYLALASQGKDRLIKNEAIHDLFTNDFIKPNKNKKYMTCDIALHGSDLFIIGVWYGYVLVDCVVYDKSDSGEIEGAILETREKHGVPYSNIAYDSDGIGGGALKGRLAGAKEFHGGATPLKQSGLKVAYKNLKSQCYFEFAKKANQAKYYLSFDFKTLKSRNSKHNTDHFLNLMQDLEQIKSNNLSNDGKLEIIKKEKVKEAIGRSPDYSDMLVMREYFELKNISPSNIEVYSDGDIYQDSF